MKTKTINNINGSIAIWYGIGAAVTALGFLVGLGLFLFDFFTTDTPFIWWQFILLLGLTIVVGAIAYVLIRVGYEQVEG